MTTFSVSNPPKNELMRLLGSIIGFVCSSVRAERYIDFGCWNGTLNAQLKHYWDCQSILIDGSQANIESAKVKDPAAIARWMLINPTSREVESLYLRGTSELQTMDATIYPGVHATIPIPAGPNISPADYVKQYGAEFDNAFVKINIEGADLFMAQAILEKHKPKAIQFEMSRRLHVLPDVLNRLHELGYYVPATIPLNVKGNISLCVSQDIGFFKFPTLEGPTNRKSNYEIFRRV